MQRLRSTKFWTIQKKNFTKLLAKKKREKTVVRGTSDDGQKANMQMFYCARIFLHLNILHKTKNTQGNK